MPKKLKKEQPEERERRANRMILVRTLALLGVFGVLTFCVLVGKLWQIQIVDHDKYEELAIDQQTRDVSVSANRGTIYDSQGNILAISASVQNLILSPRDVEKNDLDKDLIADGLSEILGIDRDKIMKRLEKTNSAWEQVATKLEDEEAEQVRQFILDNKLSAGLYLTPDTKRYYPYSSLASQVIGFVDYENKGAYGLEAIYNDALSGENGRVITAKNASGTEMLSNYEAYIDEENGCDLHLTLDATIQYYAEKTLEEGIEQYEAQYGGFCIVMNPKTGAIYAMASYPDYDLNEPRVIKDTATAEQLAALQADENTSDEDYQTALGNAQYTQWRSKALNDTYEPGSTFKPLVVAAALEEGAVTESSTFFCSGSIQVADRTINCHKHEGHGLQTLRQAVMNSCNPALVQIGQKLGAEKFYDYMEDYGLMDTTGIDLQGEGLGSIWTREEFTGPYGLVSLATASFGQRFTVTPIQLIAAESAVINGGSLLEPYVVQSVTDSDGNVLDYHETQVVRKVISEDTSATVRSILESVVGDGGTGKNAYVAGYRIGGKTGTSQTLTDGRLIVSFMGFAPADDPDVIVLLAYDGPKQSSPGSNYTAGGYYISGGNMAAVKAGPLIAEILDYMGIEKQYTDAELSQMDVSVPNVTGQTPAEAERLLTQKNLNYRTVGSGAAVTGQIPSAGVSIPGGSTVVLYLGEDAPQDQVTVPDLTGKSLAVVQDALENLDLYLRASGATDQSSTAASQSIAAGTEVPRGTVIEVQFADSAVQDFVLD